MIFIWKLWFISVAAAVSLSAQDNCLFEAASHFWNCSSKAFNVVPPDLTDNVLRLDLSFNRIDQVRKADLMSAVNLQMLLLQSNLIQTIEEDAFHTLIKLEHLDLSRNKLIHLLPSWFASLSSLKKLNIKGNNYSELGQTPLFSGLKSLRFLYLGNGDRFSTLQRQDLEGISVLEELEIEGPYLNQYEPGSLLSIDPINHLILNAPSATTLPLLINDIRNSVICLELQNIKKLSPPYYHSLDGVTAQKLVFRNVEISDRTAVHLSAILASMSQLHDLEFTDCRLQGIGDFSGIQQYPRTLQVVAIRNMSIELFYTFTGLTDIMPLVQSITSLTVENSKAFLMICPVAKSFNSVQYLDLSVNLFRDEALLQTLCTGAWPKLQTLNLSQNFLKQIEVVAHSATRVINLSNLDISQNSFGNMPDFCKWPKNLKYLNISHSKVNIVTSCIPQSLEVLDVSNNNLQDFRLTLPQLQELYIQNNKLTTLPPPVLSPSIKVVNIRGNKVFGFSKKELETFANLEMLDARYNSFQCTCEFLSFIQSQALKSHIFVDWPNNYTCDAPDYIGGEQVAIAQLHVTDCHQTLVVSLICILILLIILVTAILCYKLHAIWYMNMIWAWLQAKRNPPKPLVKETDYDAFVSYSEQDSEWVENIMVRELEQADPPFKLCLHKRDFLPGKWIVDNIIDSIERSSKTLFVLSQHFVQSEWCKYELDFSHFRLFDENNDSAILILLEPIPEETVPRRFCKLRKLMNTKTYLEWPSDEDQKIIFWFNLNIAMKS
ncbi:toll-like receptor 2 [Anolis carolinensis]|uniref:Toll-like receptor 2 n=1 Tax=Anolis carolinensis TaxID=28377 RepID=G1KUN2_ANOCA|nr:PREDICTED: toll-like receptor 2 [Anolis carolinensis]XP_008110156.1 PREDICTED: toll-like receptor 2 [Anolis carolinensis]XP_016849572.1 PREDICTED: toll-like receptor 2 [Anolis carolinensis]|eukprot:XP_003221759.1 PREDICTED: toll-like receptor 2 [Anolis carolinensis]